MYLSEILTVELARLRTRLGRAALTIVETGTIREAGEVYRTDDGWSTLTFAEEVKREGGEVYSIDLHTEVAARVLRLHGLDSQVWLIKGYSIDVLAEMLTDEDLVADVVLLDSENDAKLTLHEYMVARRLSPNLILVDDVDLESSEVVKGHLLVPWLIGHGVPYRIERRTGEKYSTGVLIVEGHGRALDDIRHWGGPVENTRHRR